MVVVQQVKCIWNKFRAEFVKVKEGKKAQSGISYNISLYIVVCSEFWLVYFFLSFGISQYSNQNGGNTKRITNANRGLRIRIRIGMRMRMQETNIVLYIIRSLRLG